VGGMSVTDAAVRSMTLDGSFRLITVRTTDLVREVIRLQGLSGAGARMLGDLVTASVLIRETMAPDFRVQAVVSRPGFASLVADSHPAPRGVGGTVGALTRGLSTHGEETPWPTSLGPDSVLKVVRSLPRNELHQSIVAAEGQNLCEAVMSYLQGSEQILAMAGLTTLVDGDRVIASGGYLLQLLPDCHHQLLAVMTERLAHDFRDLAPLLAAHDDLTAFLTAEIFHGMPATELARSALRHGCDCDEARMLSAVATLGRAEVTQIVATQEVLDLDCEYCHTHYRIGPEQLRPLLMAN
jgi:molecular chaperone Hsp33